MWSGNWSVLLEFMGILDWIKVRRRVACEILMMKCKNYLRNGYGRFCKCYLGFFWGWEWDLWGCLAWKWAKFVLKLVDFWVICDKWFEI